LAFNTNTGSFTYLLLAAHAEIRYVYSAPFYHGVGGRAIVLGEGCEFS
jgi:hypothetical protein